MSDDPTARARRRLVAGALAGVVLAALALLRGGPPAPPGTAPAPEDDAVAWVDGEPISQEAFARLAAAVASQRGELELDAAARRELLERLIDEELLLREGLALGLARREPTARRAIVSAVLEGIGAQGGGREPDDAALEALHAETREQWRRPGGLQVEAALVRVAPGSGSTEEAAARARALALAGRARAGEALGALAAAEGAQLDPPLPAAPLPQALLRSRLAAPAVEALAGLAPGEVSEPVRSAEGWWVLRVVARGDGALPSFEEIRPELRNLWLQREHERAVRAHLDELRARVPIRVAEPRDPPSGQDGL
ncbi:MAG: peptidylprolyl isomerase [Deltaproteobacteria bacterium]|nr:peptidylprolyl isomerase [Deltaproteobacteria bacterium]